MTRISVRTAMTSLATLSVAAFLLTVIWISWPLPSELTQPGPIPTVTLQDRHGRTLRTTRAPDGSRGGWIALAEIDPDILRAFIATEDERFFDHSGVDLRAVGRALRDNLRSGRVVSGASTITMQTARLLRSIPRSWTGKLRQTLWALRLEAHLDKQSILETYLNRLALGQGTVGVSAAAALYFGASAQDVSLGQAALLAALAHAPSHDNPLVAPDRASQRRAMVLARLLQFGYADPQDISRALEEPLMTRGLGNPFAAPHFTTRVLQWVEAAGAPPHGILRTSLDLDLQTALEADVRHTVSVLADRRVQHAAAIVLDNETGGILAWVGSPDFWADTAGQVDMVVSRRQPGSALKPFLYGLAFDRGYSAASILPDVPRTYSTPSGAYSPRNYDRRFRGPVRVREALASSYNVPAVDLAEQLGPTSVLNTLRSAGFASLEHSAEHYGIGLALGNGDVTLLELANAYRGLVNGGIWRPFSWRSEVPDQATTDIAGESRFLSEEAAYLVLDILSDRVARIPSFGTTTPFDLPFPTAAKTGTSRRFTDNWAVAATGTFTVAVWVGNFSGRPMAALSGISGAGPLLQRALLITARRYGPGSLPTPAEAGLIPAPVCRLSGLAANPECPRVVEWFAPGRAPQAECDWHYSGRLSVPAEYVEWLDKLEADEEMMVAAAGLRDARAAFSAATRFYIISPRNGDRYRLPPDVEARYATIALRAAGAEAEAIRWWADGVEIAAQRWRLEPGEHTIRAVARNGQADEVHIVVE